MTAKASLLIKLTGDKEMKLRMLTLKRQTQNRIAKSCLQKMMTVVAKAQRSSAPDPVTKASIGTRVGNFRGEELAKAGVNVGKSPQGRTNRKGNVIKGSVQQFVAHLLTLGTKGRYTGQTTRAKGQRGKLVSTGNPRAYRGMMQPHLFLKVATLRAWPDALKAAGVLFWSKAKDVIR
jgi:hypothetical protein